MQRICRPKITKSLLGLSVLYILTGILYALVTPALEKPDEDGHYGYIHYLRKHHTLPPLTYSDGLASEYKQPPLYYGIVAILTGWLPDTVEPDRLLATNPYVDFSVPGYRNDNRNVFLHPPHLTPLVLGARLVSLLFGLGTVVTCYFLALQLFSKESMVPITAAAVVGFQPGFLYGVTAVNNDAAIAFWGTLIVTLLIRRLQNRFSFCFPLFMGTLLGLSCITKVSGLLFLPLTGLALLFIHRGFRRTFFKDGLTIITIALLIGGWWYVRNALAYNDPLSLNTHLLDRTAIRPFGERIRGDLRSIEHTFWANPSRAFISEMWLDKVYIWWGRVSLGLFILGVLIKRQFVQANISTLVILSSWPTMYFGLLVTYWTHKASWAFGRLLFPAIAPIALLLVLGWQLVFPSSWRRAALVSSAGIIVVGSILIPLVSIYPLYHPWRAWSEGRVEHPVDITYQDPETGIRITQLIGYSLPEPFALPGDLLPVELCWKPLAQTDLPYSVFVQLLDLSLVDTHGSPGVWGGRRTYPGLGNLPTDRWTLGKAFCDRVLVQVSSETPTPLGAAIEVGFIDVADRRLQPLSPEGEPLGMVALRGVPILPSEELPATASSAHYVLDNAIGLSQAQFQVVSEDRGIITLTWQALQSVAYDATVFVHLRSAEGDLLAQVDRQPLDGRFPTSYWLPGQVVTDVIALPMMPGTPGEPLTLNTGMYLWPTLERLPVVDASGNPQPDNMISMFIP